MYRIYFTETADPPILLRLLCVIAVLSFFIVAAQELRCLCWQQQLQQPPRRETPDSIVHYQLVNMQMDPRAQFVEPEVHIFFIKHSQTNENPGSFPHTGTVRSLLSPAFAAEGVFIEALSLRQLCFSCIVLKSFLCFALPGLNSSTGLPFLLLFSLKRPLPKEGKNKSVACLLHQATQC